VDYVTRDLTRLVFGAGVNLPPSVMALDDEALTSHAGEYVLETGGSITVEIEGGGLALSGSGPDAAARLQAGGLERVTPGDENRTLRIWPTATGRFESFSLRSPERVRVEFEVSSGSLIPEALVLHTGEGAFRAIRR
jgi:hypothetical protein